MKHDIHTHVQDIVAASDDIHYDIDDNDDSGDDSGNTTSSTAQGGGGSFKNRKRIGEIDCCE